MTQKDALYRPNRSRSAGITSVPRPRHMMALVRRRNCAWLLIVLTLLFFYRTWSSSGTAWQAASAGARSRGRLENWRTADDYFWRAAVPTHYPPEHMAPLPVGRAVKFPRVQAASVWLRETAAARQLREERRAAVKHVFLRCWNAYREYAWKADELKPVSAGKRDTFGGWAATLVDSLDALWIMDLKDEFAEAVAAAATIDFTQTNMDVINVFETNIRYLGGFLAAYDLSSDPRLLRKAVEVGEMLYKAFDTPNRMPITRWKMHAAAQGARQTASRSFLAEVGSLSMEFTRLSLITGDPKWYDAIDRITRHMAEQQDATALPGMWPVISDTKHVAFNSGTVFTIGAMADSTYEYLPKMSALMGGREPIYQTMYQKAIDTAIKHLLFRPMLPDGDDILLSGIAHARGKDDDGKDDDQDDEKDPKLEKTRRGEMGVRLEPQGSHLVCFLGGLLALGGRLFSRRHDLHVAHRLVDGCIWSYGVFPRRIMPEVFYTATCPTHDPCKWDAGAWKSLVSAAEAKRKEKDKDAPPSFLAKMRPPPGMIEISDARYILRPEAIESVFVLHRVTRRPDLPDKAWDMFTSINRTTSTQFANSAVWDVTVPRDAQVKHFDSMESFWLGETLKYFYLMFSEDSLVSLDEWVFNTEAHPFRRNVA